MKFANTRTGVKLACQALIITVLAGCGDDDPTNVDVISDRAVPAASGGTFSGSENRVSLQIPAGALPTDATLSITRLAARTAQRGDLDCPLS